jgi:putative toxin-antitoxin system antitoxin component (TIGR02293 family)
LPFEGSLEEARSWLRTPNRALGEASPLEFATTDVGTREVEQLIGRLEHGVVL